MDNPRADKVAVVNEVRNRLEGSDGAVLTEYRGLTVSELAALRRELSAAGGDYKIYKNTLVRLAVAEGPQAPIGDMLTGPTAIAFVHGEVSAVAKALRDFARTNPSLIMKGAMVGTGLLSARELEVLADLPPRETMLAQLAGAFSAPLQGLAGLIEALPRQLAYGLSAVIEKREAAGEGAAPAAEAPAEAAEAPDATTVAEAPLADADVTTEPGTGSTPEPTIESATEPTAEAATETTAEPAAE
jgi:large subunit ribosomal protein L10